MNVMNAMDRDANAARATVCANVYVINNVQ